MIGEVIVVGDLKLRDSASVDEYDRLGERMYEIVSNLPGFQSVKSPSSTSERPRLPPHAPRARPRFPPPARDG